MNKSFLVLFLLILTSTEVFADWEDPSSVNGIFSKGSIAEIQAAMDRGVPMGKRYTSHAITPFLYAVRSNSPEVVEFLLKAGSKVAEKDAAKASALLNAIYYNPDPAVTLLLLKAGAKLSDRDFNGWTALMNATHNPNPEIVRLILKLGANVNDKDNEGETALVHAIRWSSEAVVQDLLNAGAKINAQDARGFTPLMQAVSSRSPEFVAAMIKAGAKMNLKARDGTSVMFFAAGTTEKINPGMLKLLTAAGGSINERNNKGETPLMSAAMFNSTDMERFAALMEAGAKLEERDNQGNTALLYAAKYNQNPMVVITLLKAGADSTAINKQGDSALSLIRNNPNGKGTIAQDALENAPKPAAYHVAQEPKGNQLPQGTWRVKSDASLFKWVDGSWKEWIGNAKAVAQGGKETWFLGVNKTEGGYEIFRYQPMGWEKVSGGAIRIAVGPDGEPWIVTDEKKLLHRAGGKWQTVPGQATDIAVGANGAVWIIGSEAADGGYEILHWNGRNWEKVDGAAVRIAVDPKGNPWVINNTGSVYFRTGDAWQTFSGVNAKALATGKDGTVFILRKMDYMNSFHEQKGNVLVWKDEGEEVALP